MKTAMNILVDIMTDIAVNIVMNIMCPGYYPPGETGAREGSLPADQGRRGRGQAPASRIPQAAGKVW